MRRHLLALLVCSALPDGAPRHRLRRQRAQARRHHHVVNAPAGVLPGSARHRLDPGDHANIDPADYDPNLPRAAGLGGGRLVPRLAGGTSVPLLEICGRGGRYPSFYLRPAPRLSYRRLRPRRGLGHGRTLYPHGVLHPSDVRLGDQLHYKGHLGGVLRRPVLSTLVPTLLVEGGLRCGCSASEPGGTGWCSSPSILVTQAGAPPVDRGPGLHRRFCPSVSGAPRGGGAYFAGGADCLCVPAEGVQPWAGGSAERPTPPAPISPAMPWVIFLSTGRVEFWPGEKICFTRAANAV